MNDISVVIPTINRARILQEMLQSLLAQTMMPKEVIIVDQSQDDSSEHVVVELFKREKKDLILKYIHDRRIRGLTQARNRGIEASTGDTVFFFDDDVVLKRNYLEEIMKAYDKYPEAVGIGGVITNYEFLNASKIRFFNDIFFRGIFRDERKEIFANYKRYKEPLLASKLSGGVASYKKSILDKIKFDESFSGYSFGEDVDFSLRLRAYKLFITPHAQLEHKNESVSGEPRSPAQYLRNEVSGWTYIYLKNIGILNSMFFGWLCFGWFARAMSGFIKHDKSKYESFMAGLRDGYNRYKVRGDSCKA